MVPTTQPRLTASVAAVGHARRSSYVDRVSTNTGGFFSVRVDRALPSAGYALVADELRADEDLRSFISNQWAEDWDSAEDSKHDA